MEDEVLKYGETFTVSTHHSPYDVEVEDYWTSKRGSGVGKFTNQTTNQTTNHTPALSKAERDHLNTKCPFYIADADYGLCKVVQVSRKYFITDNKINISYRKETATYKDLGSLDAYGKKIYAEECSKFFKDNEARFHKYARFRKDNPEFFI